MRGKNEVLAAVDLMDVNVSNKGDTWTVQKAGRSTVVTKNRFVNRIKELQRFPNYFRSLKLV